MSQITYLMGDATCPQAKGLKVIVTVHGFSPTAGVQVRGLIV